VRITVKAKPGSKKGNLVIENADGSYEVHIKERPVDGKANTALIKILAEHFDLTQRQISIITGSGSRQKIVEIEKPA
jgi:uncharacterized protein (TIGR00251 family)